MSLKKPSDAEEEYFHKADLERLQRARKKLDAEREQLRQWHQQQAYWMHCPKCGTQMQEILLRAVMVDRCENCGYIGFDKGELEMLLGETEPLFSRFGAELRRWFRIGPGERTEQ